MRIERGRSASVGGAAQNHEAAHIAGIRSKDTGK